MDDNTILPAALQPYQINVQSGEVKTDDLGQDEFLTLMLAQIKHQDPMSPMDNGEFISELAEFSTVSGIEEMNASLKDLAATYGSSTTLASAQLVGQEVLIENNEVALGAQGATGGRFELDYASGAVSATIVDERGQLVRSLDLGTFGPGRHDFAWDGLDDQAERVSAGTYQITLQADNGEGSLVVPVLTSRIIDSVEFGAGGKTTLYSAEGDEFTLDDVRQIRNNNNRQEAPTGSTT